ncbi:MAG: SH3 domain-containing protein [Leptolyngbyaceae cyanobacterium T60_A2020_046]|nr:SH3 domain-containing protein [Leptolyngbyaceae cyanobacterium T60_A2020_046]
MDSFSTPEMWVIYGDDRPPTRSVRPRTFLGQLLLILILLGAGIAQADEAPAPRTTTLATIATPAGYNLNIRSGPGTNYPAVNTLGRGTVITLTGRYENGWAELTDGSWAAGNYLRQGAHPENRDRPLTYRATIATPAGYNLNIRSGPGTNYPAVNTLGRGTVITLTGRYENGWAELTNGSWAAGNWLQVGDAIVSTQQPPAQSANRETLRLGDRGAAVTRLQTRLQALNYIAPTWTPTGVYDTTTERAVRIFQQVHGLTDDGVAGPRTRDLLYSAEARYPTGERFGERFTESRSSDAGAPDTQNTGQTTPTTSATESPPSTQSPFPNTATGASAPTDEASTPADVPDLGRTDGPTGTFTTDGPRRATISPGFGGETPVFAGPGTEYALVGYLEAGTVVTLTGRRQAPWAELEDGTWVYEPWLAVL